MTNPTQGGESLPISETEFLECYGDVAVTYGEVTLPLKAASAMEAAFCTDESPERNDPRVRLGHLASKVAAAGALQDQHFSLLPPEQPESIQ